MSRLKRVLFFVFISLSLTFPAAFHGRVLNHIAQPVSGATVMRLTTYEWVKTNEAGYFSFTGTGIRVMPRVAGNNLSHSNRRIYDIRGRELPIEGTARYRPGKQVIFRHYPGGTSGIAVTGAPLPASDATAYLSRNDRAASQPESLEVSYPGFLVKTVKVVPVNDSATLYIKPMPAAIDNHTYDSLLCTGDWPVYNPFGTPMMMQYVTPDENIQAVINHSIDYDIINVCAGTYAIDSSLVLSKPLYLRSHKGPLQTIIDAQDSARCVLMASPWTVLDGFTLINGDASGPNNRGDAGRREQDCNDGGGVFTCGCVCETGSPIAEKLPIVQNCIITSCKAGSMGGGGMHLKGGVVRNVLLYNNHCSIPARGGALAFKDWAVTLENCTVVDNSSGVWIRQQSPQDTVTIINSIFWNNGTLEFNADDYDNLVIHHSIVKSLPLIESEKADTSGIIMINPAFRDSLYRLRANSPGVDNGTNAVHSCRSHLTTHRKLGGGTDIGAHER